MTTEKSSKADLGAIRYEKPVTHRIAFPGEIARAANWGSFRRGVNQVCRIINDSTPPDTGGRMVSVFRGSTLELTWGKPGSDAAPEGLTLYRHSPNELELYCPVLDLLLRYCVLSATIICPDSRVDAQVLGGDRSGWAIARELATEVFGWRVPGISMLGEFPDSDIDGPMMSFWYPNSLFAPQLRGGFIRGVDTRRWEF